MNTPVLVILLVTLLIALVWPWLPGSAHESVIVVTTIIGFGVLLLIVAMFAEGENSWGYTLLAAGILFVFGYPIMYFPWAHHRHGLRCC